MKKLCTVLGIVVVLVLLGTNEIKNDVKIISPIKYTPDKEYANFRIAYKKVLKNEGYYSNWKYDKGGETYCGITRRYNSNWSGWYQIDQYKRNHKIKQYDSIPNLNLKVLDFYLHIWVSENFFYLENQQIADYLFDFRIHYTKSISLAQKVLNDMGYILLVTNKLDKDTIKALNEVAIWEFLCRFKDKRIDLYLNIVERDKSQSVFLKTWLRRTKIH